MFEMINYSKSDGIATITLNRPEKFNTLRMEMIQRLDDALREANQDKEVKVIILEGAGDSFCTGFDFLITQLISMKLIVHQAYDNMGLQSTQPLGPILDGAIARDNI